jgi:hypothetical protein
MSDFKPVLFFISKSEIKPNRDYACLSIDGYDLEFSKNLENVMARTMAYVKKGSNYVRCKKLEGPGSETIVFSNGRTTVCGVYHPFKTLCKQTLTEAFDELLNNLNLVTRCSGELIIGGDWNVNWLSD